jgi:hypothetical protein
MSKISLTPSKQVSAGSIAGLIFLLIFGIGFAILVGSVLNENDAPSLMKMLFYLLMIGWIGTVLFMLVYHTKNYKSDKGISLIDINTELDLDKKDKERSPSQNLRDLESLKKDGLINEKEYEQKRTQILSDKW